MARLIVALLLPHAISAAADTTTQQQPLHHHSSSTVSLLRQHIENNLAHTKTRAQKTIETNLNALHHHVLLRADATLTLAKTLDESRAKIETDARALAAELQTALAALDDRSSQGFAGWLRSRVAWRRAGRLMRDEATEDLSGEWKIEERHDMEDFLRRLGFSALQRAAAVRAGQVQVIGRVGDRVHVVTRDIRGSSELVLPLGGEAVEGEGDGGKKVRRAAFVDGGALVITETADGAHGEEEPISVCRRYLQADGRMCIDVRKRTPDGDMVSMRVVFTSVQEGR